MALDRLWQFCQNAYMNKVKPDNGEATSRSKLKGVVVLTRQPDGSWTCCPDDWLYEPLSERKAEKYITFNRIMGGIQSRTFPAREHKPCAGCKHLEGEGYFSGATGEDAA